MARLVNTTIYMYAMAKATSTQLEEVLLSVLIRMLNPSIQRACSLRHTARPCRLSHAKRACLGKCTAATAPQGGCTLPITRKELVSTGNRTVRSEAVTADLPAGS